MAAGYMDQDFKLGTPDHFVEVSVLGYVTLPCHLSPGVAMEIRWFKGTDCINLYKNGHVTVREGFEGGLIVSTQELERGEMYLKVRVRREEDGGVYTCQVIGGKHKEEGRVGLIVTLGAAADALIGVVAGLLSLLTQEEVNKEMEGDRKRERDASNQRSLMEEEMKSGITDEERKRMEQSVLSLALLAWQKANDELETTQRNLESLEKEMQRMKSKLQDWGLSEETDQDD